MAAGFYTWLERLNYWKLQIEMMFAALKNIKHAKLQPAFSRWYSYTERVKEAEAVAKRAREEAHARGLAVMHHVMNRIQHANMSHGLEQWIAFKNELDRVDTDAQNGDLFTEAFWVAEVLEFAVHTWSGESYELKETV